MNTKMRRILCIVLSVCMMIALAACTTPASSGENSPAPAESPDAGAAKFTAGTYTASAKGMNGDVTVEVTVSADAIQTVSVKEVAHD